MLVHYLIDDFDLPDFDEDEEVTGEELLEQLPKSPKSQPVTKEEEVRKIEIIDESDKENLLVESFEA